jgi:hypothetical protein
MYRLDVRAAVSGRLSQDGSEESRDLKEQEDRPHSQIVREALLGVLDRPQSGKENP